MITEIKRLCPKVAITIIVSLTTIIVFIYVAYLSHIQFKDTMVFQTQQQLLTIARTTVRSVEEFITLHSEALQTISRDTLLREEIGRRTLNDVSKPEYSRLEVFYEVHKKDIEAICLLDSNGIILHRYPFSEDNKGRPGVSLTDDPSVEYVLRERKPYTSKVFSNKLGKLAISISEPVFCEDEFKGIIQRTINIDTLSKRFIDPVKLRGRSCAWMFDNEDTILSHPEKEFIGLSVLDLIIRMHLQRGETFDRDGLIKHILQDHGYLNRVKVEDHGFGVFVNCTTHKDELVAYKKVAIGDRNWNLVVTLPYYEIAGPINRHARNIFGLAGLVILLFGVGGTFFLKTQKRKAQLETEAKYLKEIAKSAEALLEGERRLRDLVESSLTGIFIIQDNQIVYNNPEQERLFGSLPEPFGFTDLKNVHPDDAEEFNRLYQRVLSGDAQALDTEIRFYPINKIDSEVDMRWAHCRASLIKYQGKEAILVNMMDITRTKELERLVLMRQKMVSLGHVAAGIAHEIRNPLSGINIYLATLKKMFDGSNRFDQKILQKAKEIVGQLQSASHKIELVIRRVMDFSRPSQPKLALANINESIEEAVDLFSVTLRKKGIKLEKSLAQDLPVCRVDRNLIEQVILNLVTNAAQAMKKTEGPKIIEITSSRENNRVIIRVSDSGPGVPLNTRDKIFDPFFTTKSDSSGIGLSLSHRIITDHGGSLGVTASKWGGAEFRIEIPVRK
jgi:PAS domain S-box-containing protein